MGIATNSDQKETFFIFKAGICLRWIATHSNHLLKEGPPFIWLILWYDVSEKMSMFFIMHKTYIPFKRFQLQMPNDCGISLLNTNNHKKNHSSIKCRIFFALKSYRLGSRGSTLQILKFHPSYIISSIVIPGWWCFQLPRLPLLPPYLRPNSSSPAARMEGPLQEAGQGQGKTHTRVMDLVQLQ